MFKQHLAASHYRIHFQTIIESLLDLIKDGSATALRPTVWAMDSSPDPVILPRDPVSLISKLEPEPV